MTSRLETDRGLRRIPCVIMRGGTSRGPFFLESDLPQDPALRDQMLIAAMGSPHALQVDGIGGGNSLTSKVAIIGAPSHPGADVDYLFAQVSVESSKVDFNPNCGNMLAGVGPFALEAGLVAACDGETTVRIFNRNTKTLIHAVVQTPGGQVAMEGQTRIDGVLGTSAPIHLTFLNAMGSKTCALLPSGASIDVIHNIEVSLVDYAMPMVLMRASDLMLSGDELPGEIDANSALLRQIEAIRIVAGERMGLGDVTDHVIPKIGLLSAPRRGGTLTSRYLVPDRCHSSHAVTGALCVATATRIEGSIAAQVAARVLADQISIEHPSGTIEVALAADASGQIASASLVRTARRVFEGNLLLPDHLFYHNNAA